MSANLDKPLRPAQSRPRSSTPEGAVDQGQAPAAQRGCEDGRPVMDSTVSLALGRIFRLLSRPEQPGDIAAYERCRVVVLTAIDPPLFVDRAVNYARDREKGAAGD